MNNMRNYFKRDMNYINKLESENEKLSTLLKEAEGRLGEAINLAKNSGADRQPLAKELVEHLEPLKNKLDNIAAEEAKALHAAANPPPKRKRGRPPKNPVASPEPEQIIRPAVQVTKHSDVPSASKFEQIQESLLLAARLIEALKPVLK